MKHSIGPAWTRSLGAVAAAIMCIAVATSDRAQSADARRADPAPETKQQRREQHLLIPSVRANVDMHTLLLLPVGRGPYPLAVVNHGSTESAEFRESYPRPAFEVVSSWLLKRGYAVALPQRPGHGETGGPYLESAAGCDDARYVEAGYATAESIQAVAEHVLRLPSVKKEPALLVGHSAGAWGALALASMDARFVKAVINFSGGRGGRAAGVANRNCAPERLVNAAAHYGRTARVRTLWLYSVNDSFFGPALSRRMADAFRSAGGLADYRLLPPVEDEGHYLIYSAAAVRSWGPVFEKFLSGLR